jgi:hypothetical protein
MTREEWEVVIKEVYDDLNKEQFNHLLQRSTLQVYTKAFASPKLGANILNDDIKNNKDLIEVLETLKLSEHLDSLALEVLKTVAASKRISFKQFKMLSAFSKTNWLIKDDELKKNRRIQTILIN